MDSIIRSETPVIILLRRFLKISSTSLTWQFHLFVGFQQWALISKKA